MRNKFLLPIFLLVASTSLLLFCAKEPAPEQLATTVAPEDNAASRASCDVLVKTTCTIKICGTQSNLSTCTFCTGGSGFGYVAQLGGTSTTYTVTPSTKMWFGNTTNGFCTVKIIINGVETVFTLAPNQLKEIKIYDDCSYVGPFAC